MDLQVVKGAINPCSGHLIVAVREVMVARFGHVIHLGAGNAIGAAFVLIVAHIAHFVVNLTTTCHDTLVSLLMTRVVGIKRGDAVNNVFANSLLASSLLLLPVVGVAREVDAGCMLIVSEKHVLRVIVHEVFLLGSQLELTNEACNAQLLDNVEDVELAVEASSGLPLELILGRVGMAAAAAPRAREVLLATESPG